jgi:predicted phage tail protein
MPGEYTFEVCAVDLSGNASEPAAISVQIEGKPSSAPTDFKFSQTGLIPKLEWDAPSDMEDVIRYKITLSGPQGGTLPYETANTFFQPILLPRTRYSANITAINAIGRSLPLIAEFTTK